MEFWTGFAVGCLICVLLVILGIAALTDWMDGPDEDASFRVLDSNTDGRPRQ